MKLDDLHVMPKYQQSFFVRGRVEQLANVAPILDECLRFIRDPLHRLLIFLDIRDLPANVFFFFFEADELGLNTCQPTYSETLQDFDEPSDVSLRFLLLTAEDVEFLSNADRFSVQAFDCPCNDLLSGLRDSAKLPDSTDDRFFQCLGRHAGSGARKLAALMILAGADVIKVGAAATVGDCPGHVCSAGASKEPRKEILSVAESRLSEIHPFFHDLPEHLLSTLELLVLNDRRMVAVVLLVTPSHPADVDRVPKDAGDLLLRKQVAPALLTRAGCIARISDALLAQSSGHGSG